MRSRMYAETEFGFACRSYEQSFAAQLTMALAAAVKFQMPVQHALRQLRQDMRRGHFLKNLLVGDARIKALDLLLADLERGIGLGEALKSRMSRYLPEYYLLAVEKSEREKCLEKVLPLLADRLCYHRAVIDNRIPYLPLLVCQLATIGLVFLLFRSFLSPVFSEMRSSFGVRHGPTLIAFSAVAYFFTVAVIVGVALALLARSRFVRESLLPLIPVFGRDKRRMQVRDLAQSMSIFLSTGEDVIGAARWSRKATSGQWLQARLKIFEDQVSSGMNWASAWENMRLGQLSYPWLILNAAARQDPQGGFNMLCEWIHQDISHTTRLVRRWLLPCLVIMTGALVLVVAGAVYLDIFTLWETVIK